MIRNINDPEEPWSQAAYNEEKIQKRGPGFVHQYSQTEWRPWTGNGYIKSYYDVRLADGTVLRHRWPNAGKVGGFEKDVEVKLSDTSPFEGKS